MTERDRGNVAVAILVFFGTLFAAALLVILLGQATDPMFNMAQNASNTSKTGQGLADAQTAWNHALAFVLPLAMILGLGAASAAGRRR